MKSPKTVTVRVDEENNAENWWAALDERHPDLASRLRQPGEQSITVDELEQIKALLGWTGGPDYAPHPLLVAEERNA